MGTFKANLSVYLSAAQNAPPPDNTRHKLKAEFLPYSNLIMKLAMHASPATFVFETNPQDVSVHD